MKDKYRFAKEIVKEAGAFLRKNLHSELEIQEKTHFTDLVTQMDQAVEQELTQKILSRYPKDRILGEEGNHKPLVSEGNVWVIDPIDGTTNFIVQREDFAVLLAYFEEGIGKFACIYDVLKEELICGGGEFPVVLNDRPLAPFSPRELKESLIGLNAGLYASNEHGVANLADSTLGSRSGGSAGLSFSRVLKNQLLLAISYIYPWDYAAASILGDALGYQLTTLEGNPPSFQGRELVILFPKEKEEEIRGYLQ